MYIKKYSKTVFSMLADGHFDDWFDLGCVYYCFLILCIKLEFHSPLELETMNFSVFHIYVHIMCTQSLHLNEHHIFKNQNDRRVNKVT